LPVGAALDYVARPMKYRVSIEGRDREVDVTFAPSGAVLVRLDGKDVDCDVRTVPGGLSLRFGARVEEVLVAGAGTDELQLASGAARAVAKVESEGDRKAAQKRGGRAAGQRELKAPMPGRVVRVLAKVGDAVTAGQALVVIEAMKMENELRATAAATVAEICVTEGQSVEAKATLVRFG
jgi:pyruvate carboxylase subunit B